MSIINSKKIVNEKISDYHKVLHLLKNTHGYVGKFTELLFNSSVDYTSLENLYKDLIELKKLNNPIDIYKYGQSYESICDIILKTHDDIVIKKVIQELPSGLKNVIKFDKLSTDTRGMLIHLFHHDNYNNFLKKISRYKTINELKTAIVIFLRDGASSITDIIKIINKRDGLIIIKQKEDHLIIQVNTREDLIEIASDTSWCTISSDYNWNNYNRNRNQFILIDLSKDTFDPLSKIGFTLDYNGDIHAAHDKLDNYVNKSNLKMKINNYGYVLSDLKVFNTDLLIPISQITKASSYQCYTSFVHLCKEEDILPFLNKLVNFKRHDIQKIYTNIATGLSRLFKDHGISVDEVSKLLPNLDASFSLIKYAPDVIYTTQPYYIKENTLRLIKMKISEINFTELTLDTLYSYVTGYSSLEMEKLVLIYNEMASKIKGYTYKNIKDKKNFELMFYILHKHLGYDISLLSKPESYYTKMFTYDNKIKYYKLFEADKIVLEPSENGFISVNIPTKYISLQNYDKILLRYNSYNFENLEKLVNNTNYEFGIYLHGDKEYNYISSLTPISNNCFVTNLKKFKRNKENVVKYNNVTFHRIID